MKQARHSRGVSLIEALVALAVMAFGLLGVVGMQTTLRSSADLSKQRSEAVRMAQEKVEDLRAFALLSGATGTEHDYTKIVSTTTPEIVAVAAGFANTSFSRTVVVTTPLATEPRMKTVVVRVEWSDRRAAAGVASDSIVVNTSIAQVAPELGATLGLPANRAASQRPLGRHVTIPVAAVDQGNGTSIFTPPGGSGATWTFVNGTGRITDICNPAGVCVATTSVLLSGYLRFATGGAPTQAEAETPVDSPPFGLTIGVQVSTTAPASGTPVPCLNSSSGSAIAYYCAVPIVTALPGVIATYTWSGRSTVTGLPLATSSTDDTSTNYRVCRYTPNPGTDTPAGGNVAHPLDYTAAAQSLINQNFLVISAGSGSGTVYSCPASSTNPLINSNTRQHQP